MIIYNVTISIESDIEQEWIKWMKETHIPDVLDTGLFKSSNMYKIIPLEIEENTYCIQYSCDSIKEYNLYQEKYAKELQEKHTSRYKEKFIAFRTLLETI